MTYMDSDFWKWLSIYKWLCLKMSKLATIVEGGPKGSLLDSYYTKVQVTAQLLSQDFSTLPLIRTL